MSDTFEEEIRKRADLADQETPVPLPDYVRETIRAWYNRHQPVYDRIFDNLDQVRTDFQRVPQPEQEAMVKASYVYAILTQRVQIDIAEDQWSEIMGGVPLAEVLDGAPLGSMKNDWIYRGLDTPMLWANVTEQLADGQVMAAKEDLRMGATGVGAAKAPFTLSQLGFVELMCVDSNISRLLDVKVGSSVSPETYRGVCYQIQEAFPDLTNLVREPYHLQWVLFDFQRYNEIDPPSESVEETIPNPVSTHRNWFDSVLGDTRKLRRRMEEMEDRARAESK